MGDTSGGASGGGAPMQVGGAVSAAAKIPPRAWVVAHWRGELPLSDAFWFNGVLLNLVIDLLGWGVNALSGDEPALPWLIVYLPFAALVIAVPIWQVVGVWRSARHFPGRELPDGRHVGRWLWAIAACVVSATWAVVPLAAGVGIFKVVIEAFS